MFKALLAFFGLVALFMGAVFSWIGWSSRQAATKAAALKSLTREMVEEGALGLVGYVEGRLSDRNDIRIRDLVLYTRSRLEGFQKKDGRREPRWKQMDRVWPALWVEVAGGEVRAKGAYHLVFQGSDPVYLSSPELEVMVTERYEGLRVGQTVVAIGRVAEDSRGRFVEVETVASGSYEEYLGGERSSTLFGFIAGATLFLVGLILLVVAGKI